MKKLGCHKVYKGNLKNNTDESENEEMNYMIIIWCHVSSAGGKPDIFYIVKHMLNLSKYERDITNFTKTSTNDFLKTREEDL